MCSMKSGGTHAPTAAPQCIGQQLDTRNSLRGNQHQQINELRAGEIDQHLPMRIVDAMRPARIALLPAMDVHMSGLSPDHRRIQCALDGDRGRGRVPPRIVLRVENPVADVG